MILSDEQENAINKVMEVVLRPEITTLRIEGSIGTGKTTTLIESIKRISFSAKMTQQKITLHIICGTLIHKSFLIRELMDYDHECCFLLFYAQGQAGIYERDIIDNTWVNVVMVDNANSISTYLPNTYKVIKFNNEYSIKPVVGGRADYNESVVNLTKNYRTQNKETIDLLSKLEDSIKTNRQYKPINYINDLVEIPNIENLTVISCGSMDLGQYVGCELEIAHPLAYRMQYKKTNGGGYAKSFDVTPYTKLVLDGDRFQFYPSMVVYPKSVYIDTPQTMKAKLSLGFGKANYSYEYDHVLTLRSCLGSTFEDVLIIPPTIQNKNNFSREIYAAVGTAKGKVYLYEPRDF